MAFKIGDVVTLKSACSITMTVFSITPGTPPHAQDIIECVYHNRNGFKKDTFPEDALKLMSDD